MLSTAKPRLLPSGWWDGVPESFRSSFERKILREGYLFNLDGKVRGLTFFRNAYQAKVLDGEHAFLCRYRHEPSAAGGARAGVSAGLKGNCDCSCGTSTAQSRCAHLAALLFRVFSDLRGHARPGGRPIGEDYPGSLWAQLALCLCRSFPGRSPAPSVFAGRAVWADPAGEPRAEFPWEAGASKDREGVPLPEGWETSEGGGSFAGWARREIRSADLPVLKAMGHAPAQRAEYGAAGQLCRSGHLWLPDPKGRLDWEEGKGLFRVTLDGERAAFQAWALLNVEQAYSLYRKFPSLVLGTGFETAEREWSKALEVRVAEGGRLRIRPFARGPAGEAEGALPQGSGDAASAGTDGRRGVTRVFPPDGNDGVRFGDMPNLPGVGFRRVRTGSGPLFQRYTGWKTYWIDAAAVPDFLRKHGAELAGPDCDADPLLRDPRPAVLEKLKVKAHGRDGSRFRVDMVFDVGGADFDLSRVKAHHEAGHPCLITSAGWVDFSKPEWAWIGQVKKEDWAQEGDSTRLLAEAPLLARLCVLHAPKAIEVEAGGDPGLAFLPALAEGNPDGRGAVPEEQLPLAGLRPYQAEGLRWLAHLTSLGLSGILADDMGLGKTHQIMALMAWIHRRWGGGEKILVVCPTSVLYHWKDRIDAYHPELEAGVFHGSSRDPEILHKPVCITSYGIVRNDAALFRSRRYALLVLDEVQYCKNRDSETHQSLRDFPARSIIGLSGTPLENSAWDVKNLFDLLLPGYFPGEAQFRRDIADPLDATTSPAAGAAAVGVPSATLQASAAPAARATDERGGLGIPEAGAHGVRQARLRFQRLVRPFLLRRTKAQVLTDLPAKVEEDYACEMAPDQAALYRAILKQKGGPLLRELTGQGKAPLLHVFQLLNQLKQICNHPMTVAGTEAPGAEYGSGKWDLFVHLLEKSLAAGRKVVVFSQYLRMLEWIETHLRKTGIGFATLTGSTSDRPAVLKRFAEDPDCRVFCCSLKAGGVGIDLTAAETVIHYDRWWNAARENQATDRVHRIGQTKNVQVFKLITRGTIEERIDAIIRRKAAWTEALVPEDPEGGLKLFTREELMELLKGSED